MFVCVCLDYVRRKEAILGLCCAVAANLTKGQAAILALLQGYCET